MQMWSVESSVYKRLLFVCSHVRCMMLRRISGPWWLSWPAQPAVSRTLSSALLAVSSCTVVKLQNQPMWYGCCCLAGTRSVMTATITGCRDWYLTGLACGEWKTQFRCRLAEFSITLQPLRHCRSTTCDSSTELINCRCDLTHAVLKSDSKHESTFVTSCNWSFTANEFTITVG